jgi:hypothetical protein
MLVAYQGNLFASSTWKVSLKRVSALHEQVAQHEKSSLWGILIKIAFSYEMRRVF